MTTSTAPVAFLNVTSYITTTNVQVPPEHCNLCEEATVNLWKYSIWVIFALGFPGNLLSIVVIVYMSRHRLTTPLFYVALLAVVDNLAIILKIIENRRHFDNIPMTSGSCKLLFFFGHTTPTFANWILIVMSAERFTAVKFPMKVGLIWSLKKAGIIIIAILFFLCLLYVYFFFSITSINFTCYVVPDYVPFHYKYWYPMYFSVYAIIPAIVLTVFNILVIVFLRKSNTQRQELLTDDSMVLESRRQERQVTIMLVTLATVFIILTIPRCIFAIAWGHWKPVDAFGKSIKRFLDALTGNVADTNHAVNFYLYFVSGRRFRQSFLDIFKCRKIPSLLSRNTQITELPEGESKV